MVIDELTMLDCIAALRNGLVEPAEVEHGNWRFQVRYRNVMVVITIISEEELIIITAWRIKR
jgi:hypothetical protein